MVKTRIGELAREAGFEKAYHFQLKSGLSSSMAQRLYNDDVSGLELATMDRLCEVFGCTPGELFVREDSGKVKRPTKTAAARAKGGHGSKQKNASAATN